MFVLHGCLSQLNSTKRPTGCIFKKNFRVFIEKQTGRSTMHIFKFLDKYHFGHSSETGNIVFKNKFFVLYNKNDKKSLEGVVRLQ